MSPIRFALAAAIAVPALGQDPEPPPVADTAGPEAVSGILSFEIRDGAGAAVPGRLTFVGPDGPGAALFPGQDARPDDLAVRDDVIYTLSGTGRVTVPAGRYTVYASHGLEWSIDATELEITAGGETSWTATLAHEVDTTGWVSGDFHLHTLTYSGHGDANMEERIISIVGEGVEFAVATDHNHHTDYHPTMTALDATARLSAVTGNEISTPIGHFNAFPLDPDQPPVDSRLRDASTLFTLVREQASGFDVIPVLQVNHPRWGDIDYFGQTGLDPVTGESLSPAWSSEFDSIEVLNENVGWGYYDADVETTRGTGASVHWALGEWFGLLNRGHRYAAVGNSDSHSVRRVFAGYPRNFIRSSTDDPARIDPREIAEAVRRHRLFTTIGPFVELGVDGRPMGETVETRGRVAVHVRVQAASWIDCDRVRILINGETTATMDVPDTREVVRLDSHVVLSIDEDCWLVAVVEGDESLAPIVHDGGRPVRPLAITNPIWIDGDGAPGWTSPWTRARADVSIYAGDGSMLERLDARSRDWRRALLIRAAADHPTPATVALVRRGLEAPARPLRLAAARSAERLADASFVAPLRGILADEGADAYLALAALRGLRAIDRERFTAHLMTFLDRFGGAAVSRYHQELVDLLPGRFVSEWAVAGYFPAGAAGGAGPAGGEPGAMLGEPYGPERDAAPEATWAVRQGIDSGWMPLEARPGGYLSLRGLDPDAAFAEHAVCYAQAWLHAPDQREAYYAIGSDDGCRLFVNGEMIYEDPTRHGASPFQHVGRLRLRPGANRVLVKVENGTGDFGLYFRVLDDEVTGSAGR